MIGKVQSPSISAEETQVKPASPTASGAPRSKQRAVSNWVTYSLTGGLTTAIVAGQLLFAAALAAMGIVYGKTHLLGYAVTGAVLLLLLLNLSATRAIRRAVEPLREYAESTKSALRQDANRSLPSDGKIPGELLPLVQAVETMLGRAEDSLRRQRDFTNDAAHELKTSVAVIKSSIQSLRHRPRSQREYELGLDSMAEDCLRLEDLLERVLRLAQIEQVPTQEARPRRKLVELRPTCEAALSRLSKMAEERSIQMEMECAGSYSLRADPEELQLIWTNLLENAVRYSPAGSKVLLRVTPAGNSAVAVSVLDSGPGIPPVELPYIFERFHRGEPSPEQTAGGFGLGLAICKALTDTYGGTLQAFNRKEGGAELRVELPVERS